MLPLSNCTAARPIPSVPQSSTASLFKLPVEIREKIEDQLDSSEQKFFFEALTTVTHNNEPVDSPTLKLFLLLDRISEKDQPTLARSDARLRAFALSQLEMLWSSGRLERIVIEKPNFFKLLLFLCDSKIFEFLKEKIQQEPELKQTLLNWVERSKTAEVQLIAARALTLLVKVGVDLTRHDFKKIRIPGADLSRGIFDHTRFDGADLSEVNFRGAQLQQANFQEANLAKVDFGELPNIIEVDSMVHDCLYSPNGHWLAVGTGDGKIKLYETKNLELKHTLEGHRGGVTSLSFSPNSELLASGAMDGGIIMWDVHRGEESHIRSAEEWRQPPIGHACETYSVDFSPDGEILASGGQDGDVILWKLEDGRRLSRLYTFSQDERNMVRSVKFSPNGDFLASAILFEPAQLWRVQSKEGWSLMSEEYDGEMEVVVITFSPSGGFLALGMDDGKINLLRVIEGEGNGEISEELTGTFKGHNKQISSVSFSPDGQLLASGSYDNTMRLWKVENGKLWSTFRDHSYPVSSVSFSPDGKILASGSYNSEMVRLWKVDDLKADLYWSLSQKELNVTGMYIEGAQNLSPMNERLLRQKGVYGEPALAVSEEGPVLTL